MVDKDTVLDALRSLLPQTLLEEIEVRSLAEARDKSASADGYSSMGYAREALARREDADAARRRASSAAVVRRWLYPR